MLAAIPLISETARHENHWRRIDFSLSSGEFGNAVVRMSIWVGSHGPTDGSPRTIHQEYFNPLDTTTPRIDLENMRGVNLLQ